MASCSTCEEPLVLEIEPDSDEEDQRQPQYSNHEAIHSVPDDVELLACSHRFHWQCLLDAYTVTECPLCAKSLGTTSSDGVQQILCNLRNEGGIQENLDILPILMEEGYLKTFPEERKARAFLEFCKEGDLEAIVALVRDHYAGGSEDGDVDPLRYQDALGGDMTSGLHAAVNNGHEDVAWCLLILGSKMGWSSFPPSILQVAMSNGITQEDRHGDPDIRDLKDSQGRGAADLALSIGGVWSEWSKAGRLDP